MKLTNFIIIIILTSIFLIFFLNITSENENYEGYKNMYVYRPLIYKYGYSGMNIKQGDDDTAQTVFSAHPNKMTCSDDYI